MTEAGLNLRAVTLSLEGRALFAPLSLVVPPGEVVTLMGPSGAGKSSLIDFIAGTLKPGFEAGGRVTVDGHDLTALLPEKRGVGVLFQDDLLFTHMSIGANLRFAIPRGVSKTERRARAEAALEEAGLTGFSERDPATLSGGQKARVTLMRTLLAEPRAVLLDEPFSKLDRDLRGRVRNFTLTRLAERGVPGLLVTHDDVDATAIVRRLVPPAG